MPLVKHRLQQLTTRPRRVEVEWVDSSAHQGWHQAVELLDDIEREDSLKCWTVGYLVAEHAEHITIALSYSLDSSTGLHGMYGDTITIPRSAVTEIKELRR